MDYTMDNTRPQGHVLEIAARNVDKSLIGDNCTPTLTDIMNISPQITLTSSGTTDNDYPNLARLPADLNEISQIKTSAKVPLPSEILERFNHIQCHSMMGLFTEINRAWLTIDTDIYIWTYEEGGDVAYYDGLNETILCVGFVVPRPGVFHSYIKYLLILTTAIDIVVLGVTFANELLDEIQLVPEPIFTIPTDGATITTIAGTRLGRLFLGSKDGCLFEIAYQGETSWFGKRCKKINHSTSTLSYLMPSFINAALSDEDAVVQISVDNSRGILYTLSEKGAICVYDLGEKGDSFSKIQKISQSGLIQQAMNAVKTLDSSNFRPIVSISAVESNESSHVNVVAISQTGVRFYISVSGTSNMHVNLRPYTLVLLHVRLPPGYSAITTTRPKMVHMAQYRQSNLMLLSTVNDRDTLWCITSDMFPMNTAFMETYTTITLDGPAWAMAEVCRKGISFDAPPYTQDPPLVARQHFEPPRKFVVLTVHGAHILTKLRPVDFLRQLLVKCRGPDADAVRTLFMIQKEDQACATSLILACLENTESLDVADWATRAFFIYGGEPKLAPPPAFNQTNPFNANTTSFMPNVMSTPITARQPQQLQQSPSMPTTPFINYSPFIYSAKHNGLYLYLGRILRPLWNTCCVEKLQTPGNKIVYFTSTISSEECTWILTYLNALRNFLLKNTHLTMCNGVNDQTALQQSFAVTQQTVNTTRANQTLQDAQLEERQSLNSFKHFVNHCCQIIGLWRILCDHQFHILVEFLPTSQQQMLQNSTFKDLILYGHEICVEFINTLVRSYLADNAMIDSISTKLRDVCPDLYKNEDAACSKAYEMLKSAKALQNIDEKEELVASALYLCKSVAPNVNLHELCQLFASLHAYQAVADLCTTCAKALDPDNIAEFYYKNASDAGNQDSYHYYAKRMQIYKEILIVLDNLSMQRNSQNVIAGSPSAELQNLSQQQNSIELIRRIVMNILSFDDELLHVAIYEWMMAKQMDSDLIKITHPSLEKYLVKTSQQSQDNVAALNLLWKYYQGNNNPASAAQILHNFATKNGDMLNLSDRIGHLSRAVMCMRSDKVGYAPHLGVFLKDLEDKLEMAQVQDQILDTILHHHANHPNAEQAISALNSGLYDLTQLYEEFSDPFNLWECKLAIIDCAGYSDATLIESIWHHIIEDELNASKGPANDRLHRILSKVKILLSRYKHTANCVPLNFIVEGLETVSVNLKASPDLVPTAIAAEIPIDIMVGIYNDLICSAAIDQFWSMRENEFHLAKAFAALVDTFLSQDTHDYNLKTKIKASCEDIVAKLLSTLYSKPNTDELVQVLKNIQARLARC